jgi:hypothetical protein
MAHEPFLLDPSFDGTLDSDAFRAHFLQKAQRARVPRIILPFVVLLTLIPSLIFLIIGLVRRDPVEYAISAGLSLLGVPGFVFVLVIYLDDRKQREFNRRFAEGCQKLTGRVVSCVRKVYPQQAYGGAVEVAYAARTPSGVELNGSRAVVRDDLLNAALPPPGTPVVVLVLDDKWHLML